MNAVSDTCSTYLHNYEYLIFFVQIDFEKPNWEGVGGHFVKGHFLANRI
jgi:hypothetical protein